MNPFTPLAILLMFAANLYVVAAFLWQIERYSASLAGDLLLPVSRGDRFISA